MRTTWEGAGAACAAAVAALAGCAHAVRANTGEFADPVRAPAESRAVTVLDRRDFDGDPVARIEELLRGRVAGVSVLRTRSGDFEVRIRGDHGLGGGAPLFVIDGMPVPGSARSVLAGLSPHDVTRIEVLKDAASTAVFGYQGRNGVILVSTRRWQ